MRLSVDDVSSSATAHTVGDGEDRVRQIAILSTSTPDDRPDEKPPKNADTAEAANGAKPVRPVGFNPTDHESKAVAGRLRGELMDETSSSIARPDSNLMSDGSPVATGAIIGICGKLLS